MYCFGFYVISVLLRVRYPITTLSILSSMEKTSCQSISNYSEQGVHLISLSEPISMQLACCAKM